MQQLTAKYCTNIGKNKVGVKNSVYIGTDRSLILHGWTYFSVLNMWMEEVRNVQ
jgi:hypothetical protein